eukprot:TRINITY_DN91_c0_g1_i1.p2 TRINITY_DN91_c0_g1~~TRINITY_DN91_c0_g1_i1.p2  ORF type:complete len:130 (-),score=32.63 TRINITY_DN91_c0_g1_i1:75-425(-)
MTTRFNTTLLLCALLAALAAAANTKALSDPSALWSLKGAAEPRVLSASDAQRFDDPGWQLDESIEDTHQIRVSYPAALRRGDAGTHAITYTLIDRETRLAFGPSKQRLVTVIGPKA